MILISDKYNHIKHQNNKKGDMMIKIVDIKVNIKKPTTTDIYLKFEDDEVNEDMYNFLKERIDTFRLYVDNNYSMESEIEYDEILETLTIGITIIIPEKLLTIDLQKCTEIIINKINLFRNFYEAQNIIYNKKSTLV